MSNPLDKLREDYEAAAANYRVNSTNKWLAAKRVLDAFIAEHEVVEVLGRDWQQKPSARKREWYESNNPREHNTHIIVPKQKQESVAEAARRAVRLMRLVVQRYGPALVETQGMEREAAALAAALKREGGTDE